MLFEKFSHFIDLEVELKEDFRSGLVEPLHSYTIHPKGITVMLSMFKTSQGSLQKKYDKLMKEAYQLSKVNPQESLRKQQEAQQVQIQLIQRTG